MENQELPSVISEELRYSKKELSHPKYKLHNLYPLSGLQTQTITAAGAQEIIFQLPVKVLNLSESILSFTMKPAGNAAGIHFAHLTPLSLIRQIQLYTQSGVYLADVQYVNKYLNVVYYPETKFDDFVKNPVINRSSQNDYGIFTFPNASQTGGVPTAEPPVAIINTTRNYLQRGCINAAGVLQEIGGVDSEQNTVSGKERMYYDAQTQAGLNVNIQFPMKYLYNTIFDMNKDLYFGEVLQLRIVFDGRDSGYFDATTAASVQTGYAVEPQDINVTNISFFCAIEQDLNIANQIINKVNTSGLTVPIPYIYSYKTNLSSTSQSLSLRFNRAHGKKLRRIYHAPSHNTETGIYAYMRDNIAGSKGVKNFYTLLNNDRLQEFNVDCTLAQDYMLLKHKLNNSCFINVDTYQYVWFWVDDFTSEESLCEKQSRDIMLSSGIDLSSEQKWDIYMTTNNARALNHYNFAITEKELRIVPGQIIVS